MMSYTFKYTWSCTCPLYLSLLFYHCLDIDILFLGNIHEVKMKQGQYEYLNIKDIKTYEKHFKKEWN